MMTKLSQHPYGTMWSINRANGHDYDPATRGKLKGTTSPGPGGYNPEKCVDRTSKFRKRVRSFTFGSAKRFKEDQIRAKPVVEPGPGAYQNNRFDFTSTPYPSTSKVLFGLSERIFPKYFHRISAWVPGPGQYEVRDHTRQGGHTFDARNVHLSGRFGWYYDPDIMAHRSIPGPDKYTPKHPEETSLFNVTFGRGCRPPIHCLATRGMPGPDAYKIPSTLAGGIKYTFHGGASKIVDGKLPKAAINPPMIMQPSSFGQAK